MTYQLTPLTQAQYDRIKARAKVLRTFSRANLALTANRLGRTTDSLKGLSKGDLVLLVIRQEFGRNAADAFDRKEIEG